MLLCSVGVADVWSIDDVPMCPVEGSITMVFIFDMCLSTKLCTILLCFPARKFSLNNVRNHDVKRSKTHLHPERYPKNGLSLLLLLYLSIRGGAGSGQPA